ncbi:stage III sporulation protein AF [Paenibacillus castaneae]|uniref:stage III sporulation protein AF n=1 Tax=Paenibacillus castaneae TaxID=474957 RepID=UPI000C9B58A5|nr:stage III sporulation protein AF [Paenibacillus castaneae]NIK77460.1 stage III sporulation protein AF [Paenibacillus castaneae]
MVAWLSDWLRDIIAVILLAVLVELLLPNKSMQRYARLVVGLFILLTILSPILKLLQSDVSSKLDAGMQQWSESQMTSKTGMASLAEIQQNAEQMSEKRSLEAAKLMQRTLEASIRSELIERTKATVDSVDVGLKWVMLSGKQTPYIGNVTVNLKAAEQKGELSKEGKTVDDVLPVIVEVEMGQIGGNEGMQQSSGSEMDSSREERLDGNWTGADGALTAAISSLIVQGWGVDANQIVVRQPLEQKTSR